LRELLIQNFAEKYGPLEIRKKALLGDVIAVKGVNRYEIFVMPSGNRIFGQEIQIFQEKKMPAAPYTASGCIFSMIIAYPMLVFDILTLFIRYWQIWGTRKNWHIMKPLSEDIAKLVVE
jgi:hypothetical protein